MKDLLATVKQNVEIAENIYKMTLTLPESAGELLGGQFVNLSTGENAQLLRRPLGICLADGKDISVCYQLKGKGTKNLAEAKAGDKLKVLQPQKRKKYRRNRRRSGNFSVNIRNAQKFR